MTDEVHVTNLSTASAAAADQTSAAAGATGSRTATLSKTANLTAALVALKPQTWTYAYDARGNRTGITTLGATTTLTYDQASRLTGFGASATYAYNGDGLRVSKTVSGATTAFTWDEAEGLPLTLVAGSTDYIYGPGGSPLEQINGSSVLYFTHDQLGSTRLLTDGNGAVQATFTYDAYGGLTGKTGTATAALGFAGEYTDPESGLIYLRARYYDSSTTQFLSRDPAVSKTRTPYGYVGNNPLNGKDPKGRDPWWQDPTPPQDRGPDFTVTVVSYGFYSVATVTTHPADPMQSRTYIDQHMGLSLIPGSVAHFDGWIGGKVGPTPCVDEINSFVNGLSLEYLLAVGRKGGAIVYGNVGGTGARDFAVLEGWSTPQASVSIGLAAPFIIDAGECGDINPATGQVGTNHDGTFTPC
jgi:RHS repeat-associated protein